MAERLTFQAKYTPQFTQSPSGQQTGHYKSNISSNLGSLQAAASSDNHLKDLWRDIQPDAGVLAQGEDGVRQIAQQVAAGKQAPRVQPGVSLLDLDDDVAASKSGLDAREKEELEKAIGDAQERLDRLGKIRRERDEVLKDLKDKVSFLCGDQLYRLMFVGAKRRCFESPLAQPPIPARRAATFC